MTTSSMAPYIKSLTLADMSICCKAVREYSGDHAGVAVHPGMLPFLSVVMVIQCLRLTMNSAGAKRFALLKVLNKLESFKWVKGVQGIHSTTFMRVLNPVKVSKRFGKYPERGKALSMLPHTKRKRDRRLFEANADAYDMQQQMVALKPVGPAMRDRQLYSVSCAPHVRDVVDLWLIDYCR